MAGLSEFELIQRFFIQRSKHYAETELGVGDDCALVNIPAGYKLAISTDTLVENVHFFSNAAPSDIGHKALAVNLSDLAAMGAAPRWVTLALTLPQVNSQWLKEFSEGFLALANELKVDLIGGDTTRGPLSISVTVMGIVPVDQGLYRSSAKAGDIICVTGEIGSAALGLKIVQGKVDSRCPVCITKLNHPIPQNQAGIILRQYANACIDISDGLCADLGHILEASQIGGDIYYAQIPMLQSVKDYVSSTEDWQLPICGGDDYELCFTLAAGNKEACFQALSSIGCYAKEIGVITDYHQNLTILHKNKSFQFDPKKSGYQHF